MRAIVGNASNIEIFLILCIQLIYVWTVNLCDKNDMTPVSVFYNLTWQFSAFYKFSEKQNKTKTKRQVLNIELKYF